jgi:16S rRNA uridine-516 pseudouridylate synthase and related pseudouridylate synthases
MRHSKKDAVRLNKLISEAGFCSRREADNYIEQERVTVNSHTAKPGDKVYRTDFIKIDGEPLRFIEKVVPERKKPEFQSKRISRNTDSPKSKKPKADATEKPKVVAAEKAKDKVSKSKAAESAPKASKKKTASESPKEGAAKKWFSGRTRRS